MLFCRSNLTSLICPASIQHYRCCTWLRKIYTEYTTCSLVAQTVKNLPAMQETWVWSLGQKGHQEKEWQPTPVFLAGEFHEQRSMAGCRPCGHKQSDRTARLTLFTFYPDSQILNILQHALTFSLCEIDISFSEPFETRLYTLCLNNSVFFLRTRIY